MNIVRRIIGFLLLIPIWYYAVNPALLDDWIPDNLLIRQALSVLLFGLSYALLHKKDYPVQLIFSLLIAEYIVFKLKFGDYYYTDFLLYIINVYLGTILVLAGKWGSQFFCFILSPVQKFLQSIGIKATIPIIASVLFIPLGSIAITICDLLDVFEGYG